MKNDASKPGWHIRANDAANVELGHRGPFKTETLAKAAVMPFARKLSKCTTSGVAYVTITRRPEMSK